MAKNIGWDNNRNVCHCENLNLFREALWLVVLEWVERTIEILMVFELLLFLYSFSLLKLDCLHRLWMAIGALPKEKTLFVDELMWYCLEVICNLKRGHPISKVTLFLLFTHFAAKFFNLLFSVLLYCKHCSLYVPLECPKVYLLECLLGNRWLLRKVLAKSTDHIATHWRSGPILYC